MLCNFHHLYGVQLYALYVLYSTYVLPDEEISSICSTRVVIIVSQFGFVALTGCALVISLFSDENTAVCKRLD